MSDCVGLVLMWKSSPVQLERLAAYCDRNGISYDGDVLGGGKDGGIWKTSRLTALKIHDRTESYRPSGTRT